MYDITVGISCYKQKKWLHRCLRSLANQTLSKQRFEVVIVNDDPHESLEDICEMMGDYLNIKLINNKKNLGLPSSLNVILERTLGRYFVRVDSDDYVSKHFLYMLSSFLEINENYQAVSCDYRKVDEIGRRIQTCSAAKEPIACGIMFTYESLCETGFYNESFKMREGHELLSRYNKTFNLYHLPLSLYRYRIHNSNRTGNVKELAEYDKLLNIKFDN